jgi:hypothetical protein
VRIAALPPPGISTDDTEYSAPGTWASGSNVRFFHGRPESVGNETDLQSVALETYGVRAMLAYKIVDVVYLAVSGRVKLYRVNTTDWTRTDITPASGWTGGFDGHSLAMFGDILLASPQNKTIFTSTAGAQAVAIANAPDNITRMLVTPSRQVMALGCNEETSGTFNGRCIRWSDIEDYTDWTTSSSNNAGEYILPGQENIVGACNLGDYIVIWTQGSLWLGQYVGQPGQTFIFTRIASVGIVSLHAFAIYGGAVYWMDPSFNVHVYQPGGVPTPIPCPLQIQRSVAFSSAEEHGFTRQKYGEVWFFYVPSGGSGATEYAAYCVHESQSAGRPIWFKGTMSAAAAIDDPLLVDGLNMGDSTCIRVADGDEKLVAFDRQDGGGTPINWNIGTSRYYVDEGERRSMITRYYHDFERQDANITVTVAGRDHPNSSSPATTVLTLTSSETREHFRLSGKLISYSIIGTDLFRLGKPAFEVVQLGTR